MSRTSVRIPRWVVSLIICFALSNPIFSVLAGYSGVITECLKFLTTFLDAPFLHTIFALDFPLLMCLGAASFIFIADINRSRSVSATSESVINPEIRFLSWKMTLGPPFLSFLDISEAHDFSPYDMFLSIVTFRGFHSTPPSVENMWEQVSNLLYYCIYVSNITVVTSVLNCINGYLWSIPNSWVLLNRLSDTEIPNYQVLFGLISKWSINFPNNNSSLKMRMYTVMSPFTTYVADILNGTLMISLYESWNPFTSHSWYIADNSMQLFPAQ